MLDLIRLVMYNLIQDHYRKNPDREFYHKQNYIKYQ